MCGLSFALLVMHAHDPQDDAWQVVPLVREKLLFLAPADPRLPGTAAAYA